jgi:hypothetical protein
MTTENYSFDCIYQNRMHLIRLYSLLLSSARNFDSTSAPINSERVQL